jgi:hypothetical protein
MHEPQKNEGKIEAGKLAWRMVSIGEEKVQKAGLTALKISENNATFKMKEISTIN